MDVTPVSSQYTHYSSKADNGLTYFMLYIVCKSNKKWLYLLEPLDRHPFILLEERKRQSHPEKHPKKILP